MTRIEENEMVINEMDKRVELKPTGTYEEMVTFQLGAVATMLADVSRSLAVIADKMESEVETMNNPEDNKIAHVYDVRTVWNMEGDSVAAEDHTFDAETGSLWLYDADGFQTAFFGDVRSFVKREVTHSE